MSKKKKAVKKMKSVEPSYYTTLSKEQYDELHDIINWNNPLSQLEGLKNDGDATMLELGFNIGEVHKEFQTMFEKLEQIMNSIEPETEDDGVEWEEETSDEYEEETN